MLALAGAAGLGLLAFSQRQAAQAAEQESRAREAALATERDAKSGMSDARNRETEAGQKVVAELKAREKDLALARAEADKQRDAARKTEAKLKDEKAKLETAKNEEAKARADLEATLYCGLEANIIHYYEALERLL